MKTPEVNRGNLTPFDKIGLFYGTAKKRDSDPLNTRDIRLPDGTVIGMYKHQRLDGYSVIVEPLDEVDNSKLTFHIIRAEKVYAVIECPQIVFRVGDYEVSRKESEIFHPSETDENCSLIAGKLVDWIGELIDQKKYTPPPFSASFK
jgi:hypothetical protein